MTWVPQNDKNESWAGVLRIARINPARQGGINEIRAGLFWMDERSKCEIVVYKTPHNSKISLGLLDEY